MLLTLKSGSSFASESHAAQGLNLYWDNETQALLCPLGPCVNCVITNMTCYYMTLAHTSLINHLGKFIKHKENFQMCVKNLSKWKNFF